MFEGSKSSPACPSDKGSVIMSRGFGGAKKFNKISGRHSRRSVKMFRHLRECSVPETTEYFYTLVRLSPLITLLKGNTRMGMNMVHL